MKRQIVVYGIAVWLAFGLLAGLSPWSSLAYGQWRYPNKVLETVKKKVKKRGYKKPPKPKINKGTEVTELSQEPLMEIREPGSTGKKLKKNDKHYQPELNDPRQLPLKLKKKPRQEQVFSGRQRVRKKELIKPGTHHKERGVAASKKHKEQGTQYSGNVKVRNTELSEPGEGQEHSKRELRKHGREQGTASTGRIKMKRGHVREPGIHHEDRPMSLSKRYGNSTEAASHAGRRKVRKNEFLAPGTLHSERKESIGKKYSSYEASRHAGRKKVAKKYVAKPGTHHLDRKEAQAGQYSSTPAAAYAGARRMPKKHLKEPGTHHSERKAALAKQYESTSAANHAGNFRVKKKYLKEPGTLHSDRKRALAEQYSSTEAASFRGHLKGTSKRQKARYYEKQSERAHQFEGNIKLTYDRRTMHPSAAARKNVVMRSREQAEQRRKLHRWWNKLWKREQPEAVTDKPKKPRYDGNESEIWDKSREW